MENQEIQKLVEESNSVFSLVIAVAKRSRDISEKAQEDRIELIDKPVNIAVDELSREKIRIIE